MKWLAMLLLFIGGIYYLVGQRRSEQQQKQETSEQLKKSQVKKVEDLPLPVKPERVYAIKFSLNTLVTLRALTQDPDEKVRFAAVELLWQLQDEQIPGVIKRLLENETEPKVKISVINMLAKDKSKLSLSLITVAAADYDKATRSKAIEVIGTFSNKEALVSLEPAMHDYDEEIRLKAIKAADRIRKDLEAHKEQLLREIDVKPIFRIE